MNKAMKKKQVPGAAKKAPAKAIRKQPAEAGAAAKEPDAKPPETGGRGGLDPTRYGDWEKDGRCVDF